MNITEINKARIRKAKTEHKTKLEGGDRAQCQTVPDQISHQHYGIHLNPCYVQFTRILTDNKKEGLSQQRSSVHLYTWSKINATCAKRKGTYKNKKRYPVTIETDEAVETFLEAAKRKDPTMYRELQQLDLYAKEFKRHEYCHRNFTRGFTKSSPNVLQDFSISVITGMSTLLPMEYIFNGECD